MNYALDLRHFRYFMVLSEERHFGRAAQRLHISQPPLSRQIRQLESQLGVDLFHRTPLGVTLTIAGEAFLPEVRKTLAQAKKAIDAARAPLTVQGADSGRFVVGYTTVFDRSAFPDVWSSLRQNFPKWRCIAQGKHSISLIRDLKNGTMDVAFIGLHTETMGLTTETVYEEPVVVALPSNHHLTRKRKLTLEDLRGEPMFWFERRLNPGYFDYCQTFFNAHSFVVNAIAEPTDHHILLGRIALGEGVALIPASLQLVKRQGVVFRGFKQEGQTLSMGIAVAYAHSNKSPLLRPFLESVRTSRSPTT